MIYIYVYVHTYISHYMYIYMYIYCASQETVWTEMIRLKDMKDSIDGGALSVKASAGSNTCSSHGERRQQHL